MRHGLSEPALRAIDYIYGRIESPADKLLRSLEPWSSYAVLPIFALANAGVVLSLGVFKTHTWLMLAIILGLVIGKPLGIFLGSWLAVHFRIAVKPDRYSWRQVLGAGALGGLGFTMSLFIAGEAFPRSGRFRGRKDRHFHRFDCCGHNRHINSFTEDCGSERRRWRQSARPRCVAHGLTYHPVMRKLTSGYGRVTII